MANETVSINIDQGQLKRVRSDVAHIKNGAGKVLNRSIAKTLTNVRTDVVNRLYSKLNLTKKFIRDGDSTGRYHKGVKKYHEYRTFTGRVYTIGYRVPLSYFSGVVQLKSGKGVKVSVIRGEAKKLIPHAFIQTMKSGHTGVFWRQTIYKKKWIKNYPYAGMPESYKLPIEQRFGPRVQDFLAKPEVLEPTQKNADDRMVLNMTQEVDYLLKSAP